MGKAHHANEPSLIVMAPNKLCARGASSLPASRMYWEQLILCAYGRGFCVKHFTCHYSQFSYTNPLRYMLLISFSEEKTGLRGWSSLFRVSDSERRYAHSLQLGGGGLLYSALIICSCQRRSSCDETAFLLQSLHHLPLEHCRGLVLPMNAHPPVRMVLCEWSS